MVNRQPTTDNANMSGLSDFFQAIADQAQARPGRAPGWQPNNQGAFLGVPGCATRPPWLYWVVCLGSLLRACAYA